MNFPSRIAVLSLDENLVLSVDENVGKKNENTKNLFICRFTKKKLLKEQLSQTQHSSRCHLRQNIKCFFWEKQFFQIKIPGKDYITDDNIINVFRENATTLLTYCSDI